MYPRDVSKKLRGLLAEGHTLDAALQKMRSEGASIIECIMATKRVRGCDLAEAKRLIHDSTAWADVVERTDAMWAELDEELDRITEAGIEPNKPSDTTGSQGADCPVR